MNLSNTILNCDALEGLKKLPDECINTCITSPPYYGLRDYGNEGQIGLESTPEEYIDKLVSVFREVRRVLKNDGTLWVNIGDSYAGVGDKGEYRDPKNKNGRNGQTKSLTKKLNQYKPKDLIGIPWMLAFALRSDGWYLRQDIIWSKPNPMPESVTDRCTKAHEYIFLLSKSKKYYFDSEAIKESSVTGNGNNPRSSIGVLGTLNAGKRDKRTGAGRIAYGGKRNGDEGSGQESFVSITETRNKRSVWTVCTKPYSEAHFATYPQDLIVDCIKAGCPIDGLVLDPFMGAGTTAIVARKLNRNYVGFELNPEYIQIANKRILKECGMFA